MRSVKLNIEFRGYNSVVTCDYQPAEDETDTAVNLEVTELIEDGFPRIGIIDGRTFNRLTIDMCLELNQVAQEAFDNFMEADYIAEKERDSSANPFGEWL